MTVPHAIKVIEEVASRYGDEVLVGAGTVLDPETARDCILAGARFVVSPSLNIRTIEMSAVFNCSFPRRADTDRGGDCMAGRR